MIDVIFHIDTKHYTVIFFLSGPATHYYMGVHCLLLDLWSLCVDFWLPSALVSLLLAYALVYLFFLPMNRIRTLEEVMTIFFCPRRYGSTSIYLTSR